MVRLNWIEFDVEPVRETGAGIVGFMHYPCSIKYTKFSKDSRTTLQGEHVLSTKLMLELAEITSKIEHEIEQNLTK